MVTKKNAFFSFDIPLTFAFIFLFYLSALPDDYNDGSYTANSEIDATRVGLSSAVADFPQKPVAWNYAKLVQKESFSVGSFGDEWYYLHNGDAHGSNLDSTAIGLTNIGTMYAGITLDLSGEIGNQITQVSYFDYADGTGANLTGRAKVYEGRLSSSSPTLVSTTTFTTSDNDQYKDITLTNPVTISGTGEYSIVVEIVQTAGSQYVIGVDRGPMAANGGYLSMDGSFPFGTLSDNTFDLNWLIEAYVAIVNAAPSITSDPQSDTVAVGDPATFVVDASGSPVPTYQWQTDTSGSWEDIGGATDSIYFIPSAALSHTGNYRAVATNSEGSATSGVANLLVYQLTIDTQPVDDTVFLGNDAEFSIAVTDSPSASFQWQSDKSGSWQDMSGQTSDTLSFTPDASDDSVNYRCVVSIPSIATKNSNSAMLTIRDVYNPFKVLVEGADIVTTNKVLVKIWSDEDLSDFPSIDPGAGAWSDNLWLLYKSVNYASDTAGASQKLYSTNDIKQASPDSANPYEDTLTVGSLPDPNDSTWYFSYTINWKRPSLSDTLLKPFINDGSIYAVDTTIPPNVLALHGEYVSKTDTALIVIDSIAKLNPSEDSAVIVQVSEYSDFSTLKLDTSISVSGLTGASDTVIMDNIATLPIAKDTLYLRWQIARKGPVLSQISQNDFEIGWDRPVYTGSLTADSITGEGNKIRFSWNAPSSGVDSVVIWWNTAAIQVGQHDPGLPGNQVFTPKNGVTSDTVHNLTNNTLYYFGLQVLDEQLWSVFTHESIDTMKTALGDTTIPRNTIKIDSSKFNTATNSMILYWHANLSSQPVEKGYKFGYTKTLDAVIDTSVKPTSWDTINQEFMVTEISLVSDIVFDTTYLVGLWMQSISPTGSASNPAVPTDSSTASVDIPSFTWQIVTIFPTDTVLAAGGKIIFIKHDNDMNITDTIWAYNNLPSPLPEGFVDVGSIPCTFNPMEQQPAPFKFGLKYGSLPSGITDSDLALYYYRNNGFYVFHNSVVNNGAVFAIVNYNDHIPYPFVVLADTTEPKVTPDAYNDVVTAGDKIPTWFKAEDNVANLYWEIQYGPGNEGYSYGESAYLSKSNDTTSYLAYIEDTNNVINTSFGVRAFIRVDDGVSSDTANISRRVESDDCESFALTSKQWAPVRTTKELDNAALAGIFESSTGKEPWEYDTYKYRIYRWYDPDPGDENSWMEYADNVKEHFDFAPGRLVWCKTADDLTVRFGKGKTTSLKQSYEIDLKAGNWTDISLPFQFPIMLRDVLEATGHYYDSLEVYHWGTAGSAYTPKDVFIFAFDNITEEVDTLLSEQKNDGYTVFNHYSSTVKLVVPPISLPLSKYPAVEKKKIEEESTSWDISLRWKDANSGDPAFQNRVRCGYQEGQSEVIFGTSPPTMSNVLVGFYNSSNDKLCYWILQQGLDKKGGVSFEVCFRNNSNDNAKIDYFLGKLNVLPDGFHALVFDPKTMKYEACTEDNIASIALGPKADVMRVLAVGTDDYFNDIMSGFLPVKFLKAFPNPFNGQVKIQYRIPFGIREVSFKLFNIQGKLLWQSRDREKVNAGVHIFNFDGNKISTGNGALPTGVYIMRMSAKDFTGKRIYGGDKRITCIK